MNAEILIRNGIIVNEGQSSKGYVLISNGIITETGPGEYSYDFSGDIIDADGCYVMPGVIDDQVHFREPGLTYKADIGSESAAAVAGGVTTYMEMPNTIPPTVTIAEWERKMEIAEQSSFANYSFYLGASNDNLKEILKADTSSVCGLKVFMGSSTGNMLVDNEKTLSAVFAESPLIIATHCEDEAIIRRNIEYYKSKIGETEPASIHPLVRNAEACYRSSARAVELADKYGANLHILHISTARELALFDTKPLSEKKITGEVCVHHLWFDDRDYQTKGNLIKWNPAVKSTADKEALWQGLVGAKLDIVATDHAPHTIEEKMRNYWEVPSGGPSVQFSLPLMHELSVLSDMDFGWLVEKMCHAPAIRFRVEKRGFIREGYHADITIFDPSKPTVVTQDTILSKCGWSPYEGHTFPGSVRNTIVNGRVVWDGREVRTDARGEAVKFKR